MGQILERAEQCWSGGVEAREFWKATGATEEIAPGVFFVHAFANVTVVRAGRGLVLVDTANYAGRGRGPSRSVRAIDPGPLHAAIYTHGHADHAFGLPPFLAEAAEKGWPRPASSATASVAARFDRYRAHPRLQRAHQRAAVLHRRLAGRPSTTIPTPSTITTLPLRRPATSRSSCTTRAARPTMPRGCGGPSGASSGPATSSSGSAPNAGNPQKVQRYAAEWAAALRAMAARGAELLIPGHGMPILGAERVRQALDDTAEWLEALVSRDGRADERGRHARADRWPRWRRRRIWPSGRICSAVYDEPDYVVRNSGGSTAAGGTACPRISSRPPEAGVGARDRDAGRRRRRRSSRGPAQLAAPRAAGAGRPPDRLGRRGRARPPRGPRRPRRDLRAPRRGRPRAHDPRHLLRRRPRVRRQVARRGQVLNSDIRRDERLRENVVFQDLTPARRPRRCARGPRRSARARAAGASCRPRRCGH